MTDTVVVEGQAKFRDGKKWKTRWVVLRRPSPVADCLVLLVYKDRAEKTKGHKERSSITLEDICGLEPGPSYDGVSYTLSILCLSQAVMLGFESRETLLAWDARIRYSLGEVHRFAVSVQPGTKLETGPSTLHLCNNLLVLARDLPPTIIGQWKLSDLRRYGAVPNGFVFEGGTRCGYWAGVFFLSCAEGEQISFLFDCIVRGISPTRSPFGLRPVLPDPSASLPSVEEKVKHEAQELEKRLSLLSHCSRQSSTASTCSYGPSVASDERSISSSSSETSHSDTSLGSHLALWAEPAKTASPAEPLGPPPGRVPPHSEEGRCGSMVGAPRALPKPPRPRGLQEIGRQSSSDSGIATGSHSSYSGSFSSYTGSLDIGQGEEFGSLASLPDQNLCTCSLADYQAPISVRHLYDTPRSLQQGGLPRDQATPVLHVQGGASARELLDFGVCRGPSAPCAQEPSELTKVSTNTALKWTETHRHGQSVDFLGSEAAPSAGTCSESHDNNMPHSGMSRSHFAPCSLCGRIKGTMLLHSAVLPAPPVPGAGTGLGSTGMGKAHRQVSDPRGGYELMASAVDAPRKGDPSVGEHSSMPAVLADASAPPDRPRGDGVTYVNIPVSPMSRKQPHYMELELQEPSAAAHRRPGGGSTKYAQIDITATETAHRVGSQHAQCREERLQELEQRRKGPQP